MALYKIDDLYPDYKDTFFDGYDIKGLDVYAGRTDEKIGTVHNILIDESNRVRYLVIDTGFWVFGKKVLLPVGRCSVDVDGRRINTVLTRKDQVENLPEYDDSMVVDYDYEERVRASYRTLSVEASAPVEMSVPVEGAGVVGMASAQVPVPPPIPQPASQPEPRQYSYDRDPSLYQMNDQDHQKLKLYEERLVTDKQRRKTGEVSVSKRVETDTAEVSVPVEKEKIVIEITTSSGQTPQVTAGNAEISEGEVVQMDVHEETANIRKQAVVREEINIRKEVERDTVTAKETVRREELDVDTSGKPDVVNRGNRNRS